MWLKWTFWHNLGLLDPHLTLRTGGFGLLLSIIRLHIILFRQFCSNYLPFIVFYLFFILNCGLISLVFPIPHSILFSGYPLTICLCRIPSHIHEQLNATHRISKSKNELQDIPFLISMLDHVSHQGYYDPMINQMPCLGIFVIYGRNNNNPHPNFSPRGCPRSMQFYVYNYSIQVGTCF